MFPKKADAPRSRPRPSGLYDYHLHTPLCKHATGEPVEYVHAARAKGLAEICFTDHAPAPDGYDPENRMGLDRFGEYAQAVDALASSVQPRVLFGLEADYYPGGLAFLRQWLPRQKFHLVLGAVHYIGDWGFDDPRHLSMWDSVDVAGAWRRYFELVAALADTRLFDAVAHLDLPKKFGHRPPDRDVKEMARPALDRIAAAGMGIEISTAGLRKPVGEIYPSPMLLELAFERQIPICFGSDAHQPQDVGYEFDRALALAGGAGYRQMLRFRNRQSTFVPLPQPAPQAQ
jgi:histidinol-phosphatase (PHP family)